MDRKVTLPGRIRLMAHPHVYLETDRLILRRFTEEDVDNLVELDSDAAVMRYLSGGKPTAREKIESEILPRMLDYYRRTARYGFWAAHDKASDEFIGWFHLRPRPNRPDDGPEIGYRLRRAAWGRGYATEGSRALMDLAFREYGAHRVWAETMAVNRGSRRVMEKLGMRHLRTFHQEWPEVIAGHEHGDVEYEISRKAWEGRHA
jgi:RimJ/RimL family protein N-acetyltransferase